MKKYKNIFLGLVYFIFLSTFINKQLYAQLSISIDASASPKTVTRGFAGFSVEFNRSVNWAGTYVPGSPQLFDSALVNYLNLLAQYEEAPFVRIGGNSQDESWLKVYDNASIPPFNYTTTPTLYTFTPDVINGLAWTQRLSGCPISIGLNMGCELINEAVFQMKAFNGLFDANSIAAFDIGNEPDVSDFASYRPSNWSEALYQTDLVNFLTKLKSESPTSIFAAPALATTNWLPSTATQAFTNILKATAGNISYITVHHYTADGKNPPADPTGMLFEPTYSSQVANSYTATMTALASNGGLPLRMNETNSFYNGGLAGVSNAFASSIWVSDVLGSYATAGFAGVNFHGANSGPYTPFTMTSTSSGFTIAAQPVFYGMMLFAQFIQNGAGLLTTSTTTTPPTTASYYTSKDSGGAIRVMVLNKSQTTSLNVSLTFSNLAGKYQTQGNFLAMTAPALSATTGVTIAGQSYDATGNVVGVYSPQVINSTNSGTNFNFTLPLGSAGIFVLDLLKPIVPKPTASVSANTATTGTPISFGVTATGTAPYTYQWCLNGTPIAGATQKRFVIPSASVTDTGNYTAIVTNAAGSTISNPLNLSITSQPTRFINLSSRAQLVDNNNPLTLGFVLGGNESRTLLIRAAGPSLKNFGITNSLSNPSISLFSSDGYLLGKNTGWGTASNASAISAAEQNTGAFAFNSGSADSAMLVTLAPGAYTAQVTNASATSGVCVVEVYQADSGYGTGRMVNSSTLTNVGTASNVLVSGLVVSGPKPMTFLIRGVGPTLSSFNVSGALANPVLQIFNSSGVNIASNTGWDLNNLGPSITAAEAASGAFSLPAHSGDTALLLTLSAGSYTAQISGANNTTGMALLEIYEIPNSSQ